MDLQLPYSAHLRLHRLESTPANLFTHAPALTTDYEYTVPFIPGLGTSIAFSNTEQSRFAFMPEEGMSIYAASEERFNIPGNPVFKYLFSWAGYYSVGATHAVLEPHLRWLGTSAHHRF